MYLESWKPILWRVRSRWIVSIADAKGNVVCQKYNNSYYPINYTNKKGHARVDSLNRKSNLCKRFVVVPIAQVMKTYSNNDFFYRHSQIFPTPGV